MQMCSENAQKSNPRRSAADTTVATSSMVAAASQSGPSRVRVTMGVAKPSVIPITERTLVRRAPPAAAGTGSDVFAAHAAHAPVGSLEPAVVVGGLACERFADARVREH